MRVLKLASTAVGNQARAWLRVPPLLVMAIACASAPASARLGVSTVQGNIYYNRLKSCSFSNSEGLAFSLSNLGSLNFNPPTGLIAGAPVGPTTQPFTNILTTPEGTFMAPAVRVESGRLRAGIDTLLWFTASFTGKLFVAGSQQVTFDIYHADGFLFGIGGDAQRVSGPMVLPPISGRTALLGLPIVGAFNSRTNPRKSTVVVNFPAPGEYPFEIDYTSCRGRFWSMTVFADKEPLDLVLIEPTFTPGETPTRTPTQNGGQSPTPNGSATVVVSPAGTGTPTASPRPPSPTRTPTASATTTPTPTVTPTIGVGLIIGNDRGHPGDTVTVLIDFEPSAVESTAVLDLVLSFPKLMFDPADSDGDELPDAIQFNPNNDPALETFAVTVFNADTANADHMLDLEIADLEDDGEGLPAGTLMAISFIIPPRSPTGRLMIEPAIVRPSNFENQYQAVTLQVPGVIEVDPAPTPSPGPTTPVQVLIDTRGGGCEVSPRQGWIAFPGLIFVALLALRRSMQRA